MTRKKFYTLSFTWGLPLTIVGAAVALFLIITGHKPYLWHDCPCFEVGKTRWGGLNLGPVILCQKGASDSLKSHELGHAIQNCHLGPIMLIFVIGSAARYHYITWLEHHGKPVPEYDSWWFEGQATKIGSQIINQNNN